MNKKGRDRDEAKEAYWRQHVHLWEQSRLPISVFCERHELPLRPFYRWRRLLAEREAPPIVELRPLTEFPRFVLPQLDERRCNSCGDCVTVCPAACLEMSGPLPWLPCPADCVSCALCVAVCPADAIAMGESS